VASPCRLCACPSTSSSQTPRSSVDATARPGQGKQFGGRCGKRISAANNAAQVAIAEFILRRLRSLVYIRVGSALSVCNRLGSRLGRWLRIGPVSFVGQGHKALRGFLRVATTRFPMSVALRPGGRRVTPSGGAAYGGWPEFRPRDEDRTPVLPPSFFDQLQDCRAPLRKDHETPDQCTAYG
jgi:hypothetical protein